MHAGIDAWLSHRVPPGTLPGGDPPETGLSGGPPGPGWLRPWQRRLLGGAVVAVLLTTLTIAIVSRVTGGPASVVADYFDAIADRDVDAALALVHASGMGVPVGPRAAFLDPQAITEGWEVASMVEPDWDEDDTEVEVRVVLAGPDGTVDRDLLVRRDAGGPWRLENPLVQVEVAPSPLSFLQINRMTMPAMDQTPFPRYFWLFPGTYEFYPELPDGVEGPAAQSVTLMPSVSDRSFTAEPDYRLEPGPFSVTDPVVASANELVAAHLDDCAEFTTAVPHGCPFATRRVYDADRQQIWPLRDLEWNVTAYPEVLLTDHPEAVGNHSFRAVVATPGTVTLTGSGPTSDPTPVTFTLECDIVLDRLSFTVDADGDVAISSNTSTAWDTC